MLNTYAQIFGIIMLLIGFLGFVPQANPQGYLFGLFHVNFIHNLIHIATGIISFVCGLIGKHASRLFFQVFGIVYGLVALLGFYYVNEPIFGWIANNIPDAFLHVGISALSLFLGFCRHCTNEEHPL